MASRNKRYKKITIVVYFIIATAFTIINLNIKIISSVNILLYFTGALIYLVLIKFKKIDQGSGIRVDYIQSGEAALATFAIFVIYKFITSDIYIILISTSLLIMLFQAFLSSISESKIKEQILNGIFTNIIVVVLFLFFSFLDSNLSLSGIGKLAIGYAHIEADIYYIPPSIIILSLIFLYLERKISPEISLYSQGESFFGLSGINYNLMNFCILAARSIITTILFLLLGWLGGIGGYIKTDPEYGAFYNAIKLLLLIFIYSQILITLKIFLDPSYLLIIAAAFSYILIIYRIKEENSL